MDGRSIVGRRLRSITRELTAHLGGPERVTVPQKLLIERLAVDIVRLELLDAEVIEGGISAHDARVMHALRGTVRLGLRDLGLGPQKPTAPTLTAVLSDLKGGTR